MINYEPFNHLMGTLKPHSNGSLYSNTVLGTLAVDGWAQGCYIWYSEEGPGRVAASVPTSYYSMRHSKRLSFVRVRFNFTSVCSLQQVFHMVT